MRIGYVCADQGISLLGVKGASVHLRAISGALARRGHSVLVACRRLEGPHDVPQGVTTLELDSVPRPEQLREVFVRFGAEVVLERHSTHSGNGRLAAADLGLPYVLEVNAPLAAEGVDYRGLADVELLRRREAEQFRAAGRILAVSSAIRDYAVAAGAAPDSVFVVPHGVDVARFATRHRRLRSRLGLQGKFVAGYIGRLGAWHGVDTLIEAFAGLDESAVLLIVGDGPEQTRLRRLADSLGVRRRTAFAGAVPHGEVPAWLAVMDVGTAPYAPLPAFYASPLKIAEYLAAGLPVVATEQGDIPQLAGEAALLVPPGDPDALCQALRRLQSDRGLRIRLAAAAHHRARDLDWDRVAVRIETVLATNTVTA